MPIKKLNNLMKKKKLEITELEANRLELDTKIREARAYIAALEDTIKLLPNDNDSDKKDEVELRTGTMVYNARTCMREAGKPLHIREILTCLGKEYNKQNRASMAGQLSYYVRRDQIFTRTAPNTFGLKEFDSGKNNDNNVAKLSLLEIQGNNG